MLAALATQPAAPRAIESDWRELLAEATDDIEAWGSYAGDYFKMKHDLAGTLAKYRAALASPPEQAEPAYTPELVEERLNAWKQRLINRSGDRLALDDFVGQESIDDLIDFVCAPSAARAQPEPALRAMADNLLNAGHDFWLACRRYAGGGAVRWLDASDGSLVIFTRGEYREQLLAGVHKIGGIPTIVFEDAGDDEEGAPAVVAQAAQAQLDL